MGDADETPRARGSRLSRRRALGHGFAAALAGSSAGCLVLDRSGTETPTGPPLEILHNWTGGPAQDGAEALFASFEERHPDVPTEVRPVADAAVPDLAARRIDNGEAPGSFAGVLGASLDRFAGDLADVEQTVWENGGLKGAHVPEAAAACRRNGRFVAVPLSAMRTNLLFYNTSVVEAAGVDPASLTDVPTLLDAFRRVRENTDAVPLAHATGGNADWPTLQLFAPLLLSEAGVGAYERVVAGEPSAESVRNAFETLDEVLTSGLGDNGGAENFQVAAERLATGSAAFQQQGQWTAAHYRGADAALGDDWDWIPVPGTADSFLIHLTGFVQPADNPAPDHAATWHRFAGSAAAQGAFNDPYGSVPTRTDVATDEFDEFQTAMYDDLLAAADRPHSLSQGLCLAPAQLADAKTAVGRFVDSRDAERATTAFVDAVSE